MARTSRIRTSRILGPDGQPVKIEDLTREVAGPTITGVRQPFGGDPSGGLNPEKLASILRQAEQGDPLNYFELAERIEEKDPHYAAVLGTRKRSVAQIDMTVEAASDAADHTAHAEMVRAWLKRDELQDEIIDILDCIGKAVSFTEIVWDTSEGQWQPKCLEWRDPRWFSFSLDDGTTPLLRADHFEDRQPEQARLLGGFVPLMPYKFIAARYRAKSGLPIRGGLTRIAAWAWMFKAFTQRDWAIFTQTYGQPIRIGKYHAGATEAEKETLYRAVANIAGDCAAIMPDAMVIDFIESKSLGASTDHYERRSDWLNRELSKAVLGQTTTTDAVSGGHAVSQEHREVQEDIERADAKMLSAVLNRDLVRPWIDLEFGPQKLYPRLVIARPEEKDVKMILDGIAQAVPMGLRVPKSFIHDLLGVPEPEGDEELLEAPRAIAPDVPPPGATPTLQPGVKQLNMAGAPTRDAIDGLTSEALKLAGSASDALVDAVKELVDRSLSLEDIRAKLLELQPAMPDHDLAALMRQALAYALLAGEDDIAS